MSAVAEVCRDVMAYMERLESPALVEPAPVRDHLDCTAYQITGPTWASVQCEIDTIMSAPDTAEAEFRNPARIYSVLDASVRWRSRGYARRRA